MTAPDSLLIIKTSSLGDIVCALPVLSELRRLYPEAHIAWVVDHRFADLLDGHPLLQGIYRFVHHKPRVAGDALAKGRAFVGEIGGVVRQIRSRRWDVALDLQSAFKSSLILSRSGARVRIAEFAGICHIESLFSANRRVLPHSVHAVGRMLEIAAPLGVSPDDPRFCLWIPDDARAWAAETLAELPPGPRLILNPGSARPEKRWEPANFGEAARPLLEQGVAGSVLITGARSDSAAAEIIAHAITRDGGPSSGRILDLTGRTTLHQLAAVLDASTTMLTGDTGPMHMMAALGKRVVAIFGPSSPERNGPYGEGHVVLHGAGDSVAAITPSQAADAATSLLAR